MKQTSHSSGPDDHHQRFRQFVQLKSLRERTIKSYLHWLCQIELYFQTDTALDYEEPDVLEFLQYVRDEREARPSTLNQAVVALRTFYRDMLKQDWSCWKDIKIKHDPKLPEILTRQEVAEWLTALREPRFGTFAALVYHTGLRLNEARQIQIPDLKRKPGHLFVREGKGGKQRFVPISEAMLMQLRTFWKTHRNSLWLFPAPGRYWKSHNASMNEAMGAASVPMSHTAIHGALKMALASTSITKNAFCHTLRHCYATHLLEEGISVRHLSAYLGHASLHPTMLYLHLTETSESKTQDVLQRLHAEVIHPSLPQP